MRPCGKSKLETVNCKKKAGSVKGFPLFKQYFSEKLYAGNIDRVHIGIGSPGTGDGELPAAD